MDSGGTHESAAVVEEEGRLKESDAGADCALNASLLNGAVLVTPCMLRLELCDMSRCWV